MSKQISDYSKEEFKQLYKKILAAQNTCQADKNSSLSKIKTEYDKQINKKAVELQNTEKQYFLSTYNGVNLFMDHVEINGITIYFNEPYETLIDSSKKTVVVGYYKNGNPRTQTVPYSFVRFLSNGKIIDIVAGRTKTEAVALKNQIEQQIESSKSEKKKIDRKVKQIKKEIDNLKEQKQQKITETESQ